MRGKSKEHAIDNAVIRGSCKAAAGDQCSIPRVAALRKAVQCLLLASYIVDHGPPAVTFVNGRDGDFFYLVDTAKPSDR